MNESQIACWLLLGILPYRIAMDDKVGSAYSLSIRALFWAVTIERHWYGDVEWSIRVPLIERLRDAVWAAVMRLRGGDDPEA